MKKIDSHRHCSYTDKDLNNLIHSSNQLDIYKIVLFGHNGLYQSGFDQKIWDWYTLYPNLIIPFSCDFLYDEQSISHVKNCLNQGFYGLGELLIGHKEAREKKFSTMEYNDEIPLLIFKIAGKFSAPVIIHCDDAYKDGFLKALDICSSTTFIWSHIGYNFGKGLNDTMRDAEQISHYLQTYKNLYFDISFWIKSALCMQEKGYRELFEKYSNRFLFGLDLTDTYEENQKKYFPDYETVLNTLSLEAQMNIYYKNMERLINKRKLKIIT